MSQATHVTDLPRDGQLNSTIRSGLASGHFAETDLTASADTLDAIEASRDAALHVSQIVPTFATEKAVEMAVDLIGETPFEGEAIEDVTDEFGFDYQGKNSIIL